MSDKDKSNEDQSATNETLGEDANVVLVKESGADGNANTTKEDKPIEASDKKSDSNAKTVGNDDDPDGGFGRRFVQILQRVISNQEVDKEIRNFYRTSTSAREEHSRQKVQNGRNFVRFASKANTFLFPDAFPPHIESAHRYFKEVFSHDGNLGGSMFVPYECGPDEGSYPMCLILVTWLSSQHFDRHVENIDVEFIDYSGQTRFPEITFWESFYDEYPTQQMNFWRYTKEPITHPLYEISTRKAKSADGKEKKDLANIVVAFTTCDIKQRAEMSPKQLVAMRFLLRQFFSYLADQSRCENGNIKFELFTVPQSDSIQEESTSDFLIYGEWSDISHYEKHTSSSHYKLLMEIAETCFSESRDPLTSDVPSSEDDSRQRPSSPFLNVQLWTYHSCLYVS